MVTFLGAGHAVLGQLGVARLADTPPHHGLVAVTALVVDTQAVLVVHADRQPCRDQGVNGGACQGYKQGLTELGFRFMIFGIYELFW